MMTDIHGKQHYTVGDYTIHPEWEEYGKQFKVWLKSMTCDDWRMLGIRETIEKHTPKGQMILPLIGDFNRPVPPTVPMSILKYDKSYP